MASAAQPAPLGELRQSIAELQGRREELAAELAAAEASRSQAAAALRAEAEQLAEGAALCETAFAASCATQVTQLRLRVAPKLGPAQAPVERVLRVDRFGRPALLPGAMQPGAPIVQPGTRAFKTWLHGDSGALAEFCGAARAAGAAGRSFFLGAADRPTCALEAFARAVFDAHCGGRSGVDAARSGVEWWVNVRPRAGDPPGRPIDFHWDKDMTLLKQTGVHLHPFVSTVTYLSDTGAPTLVLDRRLGGVSVPGGAVSVAEGDIAEGVVSWPEAGKHITFDGRLLHGAVDLDGDSSAERITFIANIFVNHQFGSYFTEGGHPSPELTAALGAPGGVPAGGITTEELPVTPIEAAAEAPTRPLRVPLGNAATLELPARSILAAARPREHSSSLRVRFAPGAAPRVVLEAHEAMRGAQAPVAYRLQ
eukprot:TRINITY_DN65640_c0_g1_i1.p1 TRINITY_DN65640_c0_g1~~TRINITY_DN65640_c0_g1_i1.p1  ORF type:complete len:450 (+),score=95.34 TRINITY_DN65640_c0_g1_i1:76-1350(+)